MEPSSPPVDAAKPQRKLRWGLLLVVLVAGLGMGSGFVWWESSRDEPRQGPQSPPAADYETELGRNTDAARKHMELLAESLRRYRADFGDNVRWPMMLEDLKQLGLVAPDFRFMGELSGRPLSYEPDLPAGQDPSRWAICCDVQVGWRFDRRRRGSTRAPMCAVVILGNGEVRVLGPEEIESVGGLIYETAAR